MQNQLTYFGILKAPTSWAKVSRQLLYSLCKTDTDINIFERKGFLYNPEFEIDNCITDKITDNFRNDTVWTFEHPLAYHYLKGKKKIGILTYESTIVPHHWIENANKYLDLALVSSSFCRDIFIHAGMDKSKIEILNYGYDPAIFNPHGIKLDTSIYSNKKFKFINVVSPHKRKGLEQLFKAYSSAFSNKDDVSLLIKVNYTPKKKSMPFEYRDLKKMFDTFSKKPLNPEVVLITGYFTENKLASLYRGCNALVSATRGEGFGLVPLEAMACGLPVIVTGWSGHMDYITKDNALIVDYKLRKAKEIQYDCESPDSLIAEPSIESLASKMITVVKTPDNIPKTPPPLRLTWDNLTQYFLKLIKQ